ncbi:MAG: Crp/Fnr family transcriptional regulator [Candidatus Hydrogenedentota bacterium]
MTILEKIKYLKSIPFLSELTDKELKEILKRSSNVSFKKGDKIFEEGSYGEEVYLLIKGKIKITINDKKGRVKILGILKEGDFLGEMAILDTEYRSATATVYEDCEAIMLTSKNFLDFVRTDSEIALKIMKTLTKRLREANEEIKSFTFYDLAGRLAIILISLYKKFYAEKDGEHYINLKISHYELAGMLGTARESVTKLISNFKKNEAIDYKRGYIYIKNMENLKSWVR